MSDHTDPRDHPDELLVGYVDGSATPAERAEAEAHLAACSRCREEIELATAGRLAMASLTEVEPPGLAETGVAGLRRAALRPVEEVGGDGEVVRPPARVRRASWVPALAAAAVVAVIAGLVAVPLALRGGGNALKARGAAVPTAAPAPAEQGLVDTGANYTVASVNALARRLAGQNKALARAGDMASASHSPVPTFDVNGRPRAGQGAEFAVPIALDCLRRGAGLSAGAKPLYLEAATFQGSPAYVGGFYVPGTRLNFMMVVVGRQDCLPLYSAKQSL